MPLPNRIAVIFDCDGTLAEDTTAWLLKKLGANPDEVYARAGEMISHAWDPPLAYLNLILEESRENGKLSQFTLSKLAELAEESGETFYPGTANLFDRLRLAVHAEKKYRDIGIQVNCYIITGGIEEFIRLTNVGKTADEVWGSSFEYDEKGKPLSIKNSISFTEKTRYIFCINKGFAGEARKQPYIVNVDQPARETRDVPFCNMIYVGDGPSDIPAMSVVTQYHGSVIGILGEKPRRTWEISYGRRANFTIHPDYREGSLDYRNLENVVLEIADGIRKKWEFHIPRAPKYGLEGEKNGTEV